MKHGIGEISQLIFVSSALTRILFCLAMTGCGSSTGGSAIHTVVDGIIVDENGAPVSDAGVFIYETYESSISDETGSFSIESYKYLGEVSLFFQTAAFTNTVDLGTVPDGALSVHATLLLERATNSAALLSVSFDGEVIPPPGAEPTVTPAPGSTPVPRATPTVQTGNFDADGNTSAFGIPSGLSGNISRGRNIWGAQCLSCHTVEKTNRTYGQIKSSLRNQPSMTFLSLSNQQIADLTAYLNRGRR